MRRTRTTLCLLAGSALLAGCGGATTPKASSSSSVASPTLSPIAKIQAASDLSDKAGSAKIALLTTSTVAGKDVTITVNGAFDRSRRLGQLTLQLGQAAGQQTSIEERFIGDDLYIAVPQQPGSFYKLSLKDLVGTSLAASSDPTAGFQALKAASNDVTAVGPERVRDTDTTHYKGTFDVKAAVAKIGGAAGQAIASTLQSSGLTAVPFDAYLDAQGRVRKVVEAFTTTVQGQQVRTSSTVEAYDYGTAVTVSAPPPAQVKDGTPLLSGLKGAG